MPPRADLDDAVVGSKVLAEITIDGVQDFGIVVYGYGEYTSYMYPGGTGVAR